MASLLVSIADALRLSPAPARQQRQSLRRKDRAIRLLERKVERLRAESTREAFGFGNDYGLSGYGGYGYGGPWADPDFPIGGRFGYAFNGADRTNGRQGTQVVTPADLGYMRSLSRQLCEENDRAIAILDRLGDFCVGDGATWQVTLRGARPGAVATGGSTDPRVRNVQAVLDEWRELECWGAGPSPRDRTNPDDDSPLLQDREREAFRRWRRDGEVFVRFGRGGADRNGLPWCRWVEPELVDDQTGTNSPKSFGVETDPDDAEKVVAYWVRPPDGTGESTPVPAGRVLHLKANVDATIKRGVPDFWPVRGSLDRLKRLNRNLGEVTAALAAIAYLREHADGVTQTQINTLIDADKDYDGFRPGPTWGADTTRTVPTRHVEAAEVIDVSNGLKYLPGPASAGTDGFLAVEAALLRGCGARWGMPEFFSGDASNNNYASILVAGSPFERATKARQREFAIFQRAVAYKVLAFAVQSGRLAAADAEAVEVKVVPPAVAIANRLADEQVRDLRHKAGVLSPQTWAAEAGLDPAAEIANLKDYDRQFPPRPAPAFGNQTDAQVSTVDTSPDPSA